MKQIHTQKAVSAPPTIAPSATATTLDARNLHRLGCLDDCDSLSVGGRLVQEFCMLHAAPSSTPTETEGGLHKYEHPFQRGLLEVPC